MPDKSLGNGADSSPSLTKSLELTHWRERLRVWCWLAIGYVAIAGLALLPILALLGLALYVFPWLQGAAMALLILVVIFYGIAFFRALQRPAEYGLEEALALRKQDAPGLYALIDSVRDCIGGPKLSRVILSKRLNASISQRASFPWLGKTQQTMEIGLPLLCLLPVGQVGAIIAHEFGHLMGKHGLLNKRIQDLRQLLIRLEENLAEFGESSSLYWRWFHRVSCSCLHLFLRWYVPRLDARSFAVQRAGEYVADQVATRWRGGRIIIQALYSLELAGCYLHQEFWPRLWAEARYSSMPCGAPFSQLTSGKGIGDLGPEQATEWIYHALRAPTGEEDTHPSLHDRVSRLGANTRTLRGCSLIGGVPHQLFSEPFLQDAAAKMDAQWLKNAEPDWAHHHQDWKETVAAYESLRLRATTQRLSARDWLAMSDKSRRLGAHSWVEELQQAHALAPDNPDVLYAIGLARQEQGRLEVAAEYLQQAIELDPMETLRCSRALTRLSLARGDMLTAARHRLRADAAARLQKDIDTEFGTVYEGDDLALHGLPLYRIRQVERDLRAISHYAEQIWLVKKQSRIDGGFSRYVLVVVTGVRGGRYVLDRLLMRGGRRQEICQRMAANLSPNLPTVPLWHFCTAETPLAQRLAKSEMLPLK